MKKEKFPTSVTMIELTAGMCRWPMNERSEGELKFCGVPNDPAFSYCEVHTKIAHSPSRPYKAPPSS